MSQPEAAADEEATRKELPDFARKGVGPDVEILRLASEEEVADATSDEIGLESGVGESVEHFQRFRRNVLSRYVMVCAMAYDNFRCLLEKGKHDI